MNPNEDRSRLIRGIEIQLYKAKYGLAMPYDHSQVLHYEALLEAAKGESDAARNPRSKP